MKKKAISLLCICVALTACQTKQTDEGIGQLIFDIGTEISTSISNEKNLKELSIWYFMEHQQWPTTSTDLEKLIQEKNAPFRLSDFTKIEFEEQGSGDLRIYYSRPGIRGEATGEFEILKDTAIHRSMENQINTHSVSNEVNHD